jgi:Domain of unknown function (DUF4349)
VSMQTDIDFLKEFGEDLMEAAWRESFAPSNVKPRRPRRRWSRRRLGAVIAAGSIALAGGIGYFALSFGRGPSGLTESVHNAGGPARSMHGAFGNQPALTAPRVPSSAGTTTTAGGGSLTGGGAGGSGGTTAGAPTDQAVRGHVLQSTTTTTTPPRVTKQEPSLAQVVKTASLDLVLPRDAFSEDFQKATAIAARLGGFVQSSSTSGSRSGTLFIRVPSHNFEFALGAIRKLGRVEFQTVTGRDVTSQFIDLGARLRIAKNRLRILLKLQGQATSVGQTLQIQNVIDQTQFTIEDIQGQLRYLSRQTSFGTIHLDMHERGAPVRHRRHHHAAPIHTPSFTRGAKHAFAGFVGVIVAVVVGLGYLAPIAVLGLIVWLVVRRVRRSRATA